MDRRVVTRRLALLQDRAITHATPVSGWEARTGLHTTPNTYTDLTEWSQASTPLQVAAGLTVFLRATVDLPQTLPLENVWLQASFSDMEGLLSVDGLPYCGLDSNHLRTPFAKAGQHQLDIEFMVCPSSFRRDNNVGIYGQFMGLSVVVISPEIEALYHDVRTAWETSLVVQDDRRRELLHAAVEQALVSVDLTAPVSELIIEATSALQAFRHALSDIHPDPESGSLYAVGHTHIDTAWLWPLRETIRKCGRTFATACRLMERYPEFHFTCSQPQLYAYTKTHYPALYDQIRHWVAEGRWETAGAMWVEADCNVTSGESLIRQMLYGIEFFQQEFGTRPRICWLPDVFGYPASLPEILHGCGVERFYTYKLHWQKTNAFPYHLFRWRGLDGSEVLAHVVNHRGAYNNSLCPEHLHEGWHRYAQKTQYPEVIFPFGFGDGGGGVTYEHMETYRRVQGHYPGLPAVRLGTAENYFDEAQQAWSSLPVWDGELYVETHRGTYTTQSEMKRLNRRCELLLREMEILTSALQMRQQYTAWNAERLGECWKTLLLYQFHDILPGSSIHMVYAEAIPVLQGLEMELESALAEARLELFRPVCDGEDGYAIINSLSWPRHDVVRIPANRHGIPKALEDASGRVCAVQTVDDGQNGIIGLALVSANALAVTQMRRIDAPVESPEALIAEPGRLESHRFKVLFNDDGAITSLYDKRFEREIVPPGAVLNDLQLLQDGPEHEDAWNIHESINLRRYPFDSGTQMDIVECGPVRAGLRFTRKRRNTTLTQTVYLYAELDRIEFDTSVDWQERQTVLKAAFPLNLRVRQASFEVQFGAYERATHRNTSWEQQKYEVAGHRWVDLSETGYGVSLLNDSRYGYDVHDNVLRITLLRSTISPDPEADRGHHRFRYALYPHAGSCADAETVKQGWAFNVPLETCRLPLATDLQASCSLVDIQGPAILETLKPAQDGRGWIMRLYEPYGSRGTCTVRLPEAIQSVTACNHVEEDGEPVAVVSGYMVFPITPYQIRSFRLQ